MTNRRLILAGWPGLVLAIVVSGVGLRSTPAWGQDALAFQRVRTLMWYPHLPIADRLLPDDEVVELDSPFKEHLLNQVVLNRAETIRSLTRRASLVAIAEVTGVAGVLDIDRTRPQTRLTGLVHDVLQHSTQCAVGDARPFPLEVVVYRGTVRIGSVIVRMGLRPEDVDPLPLGRYVLFLESDGAGGLSVFHPPLRIVAGKVTYPWGYRFPPQAPNPFDGMSVDELSAAVRRATPNTGSLGLMDHVDVHIDNMR